MRLAVALRASVSVGLMRLTPSLQRLAALIPAIQPCSLVSGTHSVYVIVLNAIELEVVGD